MLCYKSVNDVMNLSDNDFKFPAN